MGKVHEILEKEVSDIRGRIITNLKGMFIAKQLTGKFLTLTYGYGISDELITGVDCNNNSVATDMSDSYSFGELEVDILLWLLGMIEDDKFDIIED